MTFDNKCEFCDATKMSHHSFTWICEDCRATIKANHHIAKKLRIHAQSAHLIEAHWAKQFLGDNND